LRVKPTLSDLKVLVLSVEVVGFGSKIVTKLSHQYINKLNNRPLVEIKYTLI